ncbi:MAG: response regulator [Myxococcales bacterium]|nr:response regulator [Myxococcales bacterium]
MTTDKKALGKIALQRQVTQSGEDPAEALEKLRALSEKHGVPGLDLTQVAIPLEHLALLPREIAVRHVVLPVLVQDERIFLAMANPDDKRVIDELEFVTGKRVFPYVAPEPILAKVIEASYELKTRGESYYLGPMVPQEVLVKLGLAEAPVSSSPPIAPPPRPPPPALPPRPPLRRHASDDRMPASIIAEKLEREAGPENSLLEGDFGGGSDLSTVGAVPVPTSGGSYTGPNPGTANGKTVLVVDDEEDIRRLLKRVLTDRGYKVLEADRGSTALRLVKEQVPDLIILDAMLPELHGFEICRRIKGSQKYGQIPIIMVSAVYRGWRYAEDLRTNYGVDAYIEKPFRITEVMKAVEQAILSKKGDNSAAQLSKEEISAEAEKSLQAGIAAYQAGDLDTAVNHLRRGSQIDPLAYRVHYHLGLLYGKKNLLFEAIQALETAVEINGRHFPALKNLAVLYQKAGFKLKAIEMWERALGQAPDDTTRHGIKEHLLTLL